MVQQPAEVSVLFPTFIFHLRLFTTIQKIARALLLIACAFLFISQVHAYGPGDPITNSVAQLSFPGIVYDLKNAPDSTSFSIPFTRAGNLMLIKVRVDTTEGSFILDTGCPGLVLNITYFRQYPRSSEAGAENDGINGTFGQSEHTYVKEIHFGNIREYNMKADLVGLGNIENSKGVKITGLIGMRFLKDCEMIFDFENKLIHFHVIAKSEAKTYRHPMLKDTSLYQVLPFDITENRVVVKTVIEGKKVKLVIDCAAETNILDSRLPDKIMNNVAITGRILLTGVGNKKIEAVKGTVSNFTLGNRGFGTMPVLVTNLEKTCFSMGGCVDGVLGFDFLAMQKIGFNFVTRKMYIWK